jgi:hypothetical protein
VDGGPGKLVMTLYFQNFTGPSIMNCTFSDCSKNYGDWWTGVFFLFFSSSQIVFKLSSGDSMCIIAVLHPGICSEDHHRFDEFGAWRNNCYHQSNRIWDNDPNVHAHAD